MPGKIPDLINQHIEDQKVKLETSSFAAIHQMIVTILQKECAAAKAKRNFQKQLHFSTKVCNNFPETYNFGCKKNMKKKAWKSKEKSCICDKSPIRKKKFFPLKKKFQKKRYVFRKRSKPSKKVTCFICGKEGHYANTCLLYTSPSPRD